MSIKTASRVINGKPHVSEAVRRRTWEAVERLNYAPDERARRLASMRSASGRRLERVGVVLFPAYAKYAEPFFCELLEALEGAILDRGMTAAFCHSLRELRDNRRLRWRLSEADGAVLVGLGEPYREDVEDIRRRVGRAVILSDYLADRSVTSVCFDRRQGATLVVNRLTALGHERIACVTGFRDARPYNRQGEEAFRAAMEGAGLRADEALIREGRYTVEGACEAADRLLNGPAPRPTAIFSVSDPMALGVYNAIRKNGLRVGADVSVAACDDIRLGGQLYPALTTAGGDKAALARAALGALREEVEGERAEPVSVTLPMRLIERESCAPPARA